MLIPVPFILALMTENELAIASVHDCGLDVRSPVV